MKLIRAMLVTPSDTPYDSITECRQDLYRYLKGVGVSEARLRDADKAPFQIIIGKPPEDSALSDLATETFGRAIWNQSAYRVEIGSINHERLGSGRLLLVYEHAEPEGSSQCELCANIMQPDPSSDLEAWQCAGIGCDRIYCSDHFPESAECACGGVIRGLKVKYLAGTAGAKVGQNQLLPSDVQLGEPAIVRVRLPGGYFGIEMSTAEEAEEALRTIRSLVESTEVVVYEVVGRSGVATKNSDVIKDLLGSTGIIASSRRMFLKAV